MLEFSDMAPKAKKVHDENAGVRLLRTQGERPSAGQVLETALTAGSLPITARPGRPPVTSHDYTQFDPQLARSNDPCPAPPLGSGYASLSPAQRGAYLRWLADMRHKTPPGYQQLYLASLEVELLENPAAAPLFTQRLEPLLTLPYWARSLRERTLFWAYWLQQNGAMLDRLLEEGAFAELAGQVLGALAHLGWRLRAGHVRTLGQIWLGQTTALTDAVLDLRLHSLRTQLGAEPLLSALAGLGAAAGFAQPLRLNHRDLRVAVAVPDLRPLVEPWLNELLTVTDAAVSSLPAANGADQAENSDGVAVATDYPATQAHIIVEFSQSRSQTFEMALKLASRHKSFRQLMDEQRTLVYRVTYRSSEMHSFWRLWEFVQSWSSTRIYCRGKELQGWQVYPYSEHLR